jgi:hypothetical protein
MKNCLGSPFRDYNDREHDTRWVGNTISEYAGRRYCNIEGLYIMYLNSSVREGLTHEAFSILNQETIVLNSIPATICSKQ